MPTDTELSQTISNERYLPPDLLFDLRRILNLLDEVKVRKNSMTSEKILLVAKSLLRKYGA